MATDSSPQTSPSTDTFNPYPGLRPFRSDEDYLFFGREEQVAELLGLLATHRFVAVVGTSGSGKSSLVRCGLLSELQGGSMVQAGSHWDVAVMQPGGDPLRHLARALCHADLYDADDPSAIPQVLATLMRSRNGLVEAARQSGLEPGSNILLVVDQFEEIFRFHDAGKRGREQAPDFIRLLLTACDQTEVPIYVVLTMRSDFLGDCPEFSGLPEAVNEGEYLIPRLTRDQSRSAIEGPARVAGGEISRRLVQRLLNDLGSETEQLPVLQHALMRTWERWLGGHESDEPVDLRHYEAVGGMQEALSRHADEVLRSLSASEQKVAEKIFKALTEKGPDGRGVRRPTSLENLAAIASAEPESINRVIDAYRRPGVTLIMPGQDVDVHPESVIDISHETLMRIWERLRAWVEEESQSVRIFQRLADTARLWKKSQAGLYHDPDLQIACSWREENRPSVAWAAQYGGGFDEATEFLDASREAAEATEREREAARQRELEQARTLAATQQAAARNFKRFSAAMVVVALLALAAMVYALRAHREAEQARAHVARSLSRSDLIRGSGLLEQHDSARGLELLLNSHAHDKSARAPLQSMYNVLLEKPILMPALELSAGDGRILSIAVRRKTLAAGDSDGRVLVFDLETGGILKTLQHASGSPVVALAWSKDANLLATATEGGFAHLWDWKEGNEIQQLDYPFTPRISHLGLLGPKARLVAELSYPGGRWVAAWEVGDERPRYAQTVPGSPEGLSPSIVLDRGDSQQFVAQVSTSRLNLLDAERGLVRLFPDTRDTAGGESESEDDTAAAARITAFNVSPDGAWLAVATDENVVLKHIKSGREALVEGVTGNVVDLRFSQDGRQLITSADDGAARIFAVEGQRALGVLRHSAPVREAWFGPDGLLVLTVSVASEARMWHVETGEPLVEPFPYHGPYGMNPFVADGSRVLVRQGGNRLRLLKTRSVPRLALAMTHPSAIHDVAFGPAGALVATACDDGSACLWRAADGTLRSRLDHESAVVSVAFAPDAKRLLTVTRGGLAHVWDADRAREITRIASPRGVIAAEFSLDGQSVLTRMEYGAVQVWESTTGEPRGPCLRHEHPVLSAALSSDGKLVAAGTKGGAVVVWDVGTARVLHRIEDRGGPVEALRFQPGGELLGYVMADGTLRVAHARTGEESLTVSHEITDLVWRADGRVILTRCSDHSVHLWDATSAELIGSPIDHLRPVTSAVFGPLGRRILTVSGNSARVWDALTGQPLSRPLEHGNRAISAARFGPDGLRVATGSDDRMLQLWDVGLPSNTESSSLVALAAAVLHDQEGDRGESWRAAGSLGELRGQALRATGATGDRLRRWYFTEPEEQTLSPNCDVKLSSRLERSFERGDLTGLRWTVLLRPRDPLARAQLAVSRLRPQRSSRDAFYSRLDLEFAIERAPVDPEIRFLAGLGFDLLGDDEEAKRSYARMWEIEDEPDLETLRRRLDLRASFGVATSSEARREATGALLDRAIQIAESAGVDGETVLADLRAQRLDLLTAGGRFREAATDWQYLRAQPALPSGRTEQLFPRFLDAAQEEFVRATASERKERLLSYTAAALLRWFLPIYNGELSAKWRYRDFLRGLGDTEVSPERLVAKRSQWNYLDDGTDPGPGWYLPDFDDSTWKSGSGRLGFPLSDGRETRLEILDAEENKITTYYFRHSFELDAVPTAPDFLLEILHDDGVIVYLNGKKLLRRNMPSGPVTRETFAEDTIGGADERTYVFTSQDGTGLREGVNVLAAEVHQSTPGSTDLGFDLALDVGMSARTYLDGFSQERWDELVREMESLVPETDENELQNAVRLAFSRKPLEGTARAWLARAHIQHALWNLPEALTASERALVLARKESQSALSAGAPAPFRVNGDCLRAKRNILRALGRRDDSELRKQAIAGPQRDPSLHPRLIDLTEHYNASRYVGALWHSSAASRWLNSMPDVVTGVGGTPYDARGIIQLNSGVYPASIPGAGAVAGKDLNGAFGTDYPDSVTIPIRRAAKTVSFLNSTIYGRAGEAGGGADAEAGRVVARYIFHYADGSTAEEPLVWGRDVVDWRQRGDLEDLRSLAWIAEGQPTSLQEKVWHNPHPEKIVSHIDFVSEKIEAAPFLMAITLGED